MFDRSQKDLTSLYNIITEQDDSQPPQSKEINLTPGEIQAMKKEVLSTKDALVRACNSPVWAGEEAPYNVHGNILKRLKVTVITPDMPESSRIRTMAVSNKGDLFINYNFFNELKASASKDGVDVYSYINGVYMHEAFHVYNETFARQGERKGGLWNVATDYVMNRDLVKDGFALPSLGLIPEKREDGRWWVKIDVNNIAHAGSQDGQIVSTDNPIVEFDITDSTCEEVYQQFEDKFQDIPEELKQQIIEELERQSEEMDSHPTDEDEEGEGAEGEGDGEEETEIQKIAKEAAEEAEKNGQAAPDKDNQKDEDAGNPDGEPQDGATGQGAGEAGGEAGTGKIETSELESICSKFEWRKKLSSYLTGGSTVVQRGKMERIRAVDPLSRDETYTMSAMRGGRVRPGFPNLRGTVSRPVDDDDGNDSVTGVFCLDTSGSMNEIMENVRYSLACLAKEFMPHNNRGNETLKISIVHQMKVVDPSSYLELDSSQSMDQIVDSMNEAWAKTQTGGGGPDFNSAVDYFADLKQKNPKLKHFFIVSDAGWTDGSMNTARWTELEQKIQMLNPSGAPHEGLCIVRTIDSSWAGFSDGHPLSHMSGYGNNPILDNIIAMTADYIDIEMN